MMVYVAYALTVLHVALGVLQAETSPLLAGLLGVRRRLGAGAARDRRLQERTPRSGESDARADADGFIDVCAVDDIRENRGKVVCLGGERVAVFRYDGKISRRCRTSASIRTARWVRARSSTAWWSARGTASNTSRTAARRRHRSPKRCRPSGSSSTAGGSWSTPGPTRRGRRPIPAIIPMDDASGKEAGHA